MADDWPGRLVVGDGWRIVLARDMSRYVVQTRGTGKDKRWSTLYGPTSVHPGLAEVRQSLPVDPQDAAATLAAAQGVVADPNQDGSEPSWSDLKRGLPPRQRPNR